LTDGVEELVVRYFVRYNVQKSEEDTMQKLKIEQDIRPMSEFRTGIASFLKQVHDTKRPLIITQHGKGVAVLLDVQEYEAMQEKIEILQDIQISMSQLENGEEIENGDAKAMVLKRAGK
jgi:antitoxin YefM